MNPKVYNKILIEDYGPVKEDISQFKGKLIRPSMKSSAAGDPIISDIASEVEEDKKEPEIEMSVLSNGQAEERAEQKVMKNQIESIIKVKEEKMQETRQKAREKRKSVLFNEDQKSDEEMLEGPQLKKILSN